MARILVTEEIADTGLQKLRDAGHDVDIQLGLSPEALLDVVKGAHALIIRSATTVTREVIEAGTDLIVVGRAGIGLPVANAALKAGRWERKQWTGVELADKTLGIVGFGRIGTLVAQRARAFGMNLIAYDPFVSADRARRLDVELVDLDTVAARADFVTLHLVKTPETVGLLGKDFFDKAKPGMRVVNVARGGIIDEDALAQAIRDGNVAGAALDVFATEPTTESPLFELDEVVVTPHLGASTHEAQDKAGDTIADMVGLASQDRRHAPRPLHHQRRRIPHGAGHVPGRARRGRRRPTRHRRH